MFSSLIVGQAGVVAGAVKAVTALKKEGFDFNQILIILTLCSFLGLVIWMHKTSLKGLTKITEDNTSGMKEMVQGHKEDNQAIVKSVDKIAEGVTNLTYEVIKLKGKVEK